MEPLVSVSVDLDPIPCYYRIHALGDPPDELRDVVLTRALPRLAALFARHGIHVAGSVATFYLWVAVPGGRPSLEWALDLLERASRAAPPLRRGTA